MKTSITILFLGFCCICFSQDQSGQYLEVELNGSAFFNSKRHFYYNGDEGIYKELKINYPIGDFFELGIFAGHQHRSYGYYKKINNDLVVMFMDRDYTPVGFNFRLNLTNFFVNELKWIKQKEKWKAYTQLMPTMLLVRDKRSAADDGQNIVYLYPYTQPDGQKYLGFMTGVKYFVGKNFGFTIEGGDGAIATLQVGATLRW